MKLSTVYLSQKPRIFRQLTGLSLNNFHDLMKKCGASLKKAFPRIGRQPKIISLEDKVLLLLIYYRCYVTHEFLGYFVELDNCNVSRLFKRLEPLIADKISIKKDRTLTGDQVNYLLVDATEQPIQRPVHRKIRQRYYSGKKKQYTQKIEIAVTDQGKISHISKSCPGKQHDFRLRQTSDHLPSKLPKYGDLGYQGWQKIASQVRLPHKKPKGKCLSSEQKQANRAHSKIRIAIEHCTTQAISYFERCLSQFSSQTSSKIQ